MPINVYAWPPVGALSTEWTQIQPVARLRSALTGRDQAQASQRARRVATVQVSALAAGRMGAGYCEMLKQLLAGGIHGVRLKSTPINWWHDEPARVAAFNSQPLNWRTAGNPLGWKTDGNPLTWFIGGGSDGSVVARSVSISGPNNGLYTLRIEGLPRNTIVGRPGDFLRVYDLADASTSEVARVVHVARTNGAGVAQVRIDRPIALIGGRVNMAGQDEAVFRVEGDLPRAIQPLSGDWSYTWSFREVFADEVGGFREVNPWT